MFDVWCIPGQQIQLNDEFFKSYGVRISRGKTIQWAMSNQYDFMINRIKIQTQSAMNDAHRQS